MAAGLDETTKKTTVNLTQLRKNVRKRPDKTSNRKRPRVNDTDVVAAGDGDDATTSAVAVAVAGLTQPVADDDDVATSDVAATTADDDRCSACGFPHPPPEKAKRSKHVQWVQCEGCQLWYHNVCEGLKCNKRVKRFVCDKH